MLNVKLDPRSGRDFRCQHRSRSHVIKLKLNNKKHKKKIKIKKHRTRHRFITSDIL